MSMLLERRLKRAEQLCEQTGGRLTSIRKILLSIIYQNESDLTAYELLNIFRETYPKAESMTIYRALDFLQKHHLIHRLASKSTYAACEIPHQDHHAHFLLCEKCGQSQEVQSSQLERTAKTLAANYHFALSNKPIEMMGLCKTCSRPI